MSSSKDQLYSRVIQQIKHQQKLHSILTRPTSISFNRSHRQLMKNCFSRRQKHRFYQQGKKEQRINLQNQRMLCKLIKVSTSKSQHGSLPKIQSSNFIIRRQKYDKIAIDNQNLLNRLNTKGPSISAKKQYEWYKQLKSHSDRLRKFEMIGDHAVSKQQISKANIMKHKLGFK